MRNTARAIIIKDKKLLLVTGHGADFFWTPGGKIENDESAETALLRELKEELTITHCNLEAYNDYEIDEQRVTNFIVTSDDTIVPANEISDIFYFSKEDFMRNDIKISKEILNHYATKYQN